MPNTNREKPRTSEEIAADIGRTRQRMDATLDALQKKLKPSTLARDAVKRVTSSSVRKAAAIAENVADSKAMQGAMKFAAQALGSSERVDDRAEVIEAQAAEDEAVTFSCAGGSPRKGKSTAKRVTGAAVAAVLTAAAVKAVHAAYDKRSEKPAKRRAKATKSNVARSSKSLSRRRSK